MARSNFETLEVYRLSEEVADEVWGIVVAWLPLARDTIGKQLIRSADSIGANIAEGAGRGSFPDNRRFIRYARGSLNETRHFLRRAFRRNLMNKDMVCRLRPLLDELAPRLNAYLKSIGRGSASPPAGADEHLTTDNGQRTTG
ncbi:MAG: four helix bundle protein [Isosphaeraceae bacterium]